MHDSIQELFSHPYIGTPIAIAATVGPWWMEYMNSGFTVLLQILGGVFLVMQIYYLYKNKGKK